MKKIIALSLVLLLAFGGGIAAFANSQQPTGSVPVDTVGTRYEAAVKMLIEKDVLSGYDDGTFQPDAGIDRAEACAVVVKVMNPFGADLYNAQKLSEFTDMEGYNWALKYVNYAVEKGVVSGIGNGRFEPSRNVTYNEMAAMLVNAVGYQAEDLVGDWPENYVTKAKELMIFSDSNLNKDGNAYVTRGDAALMTAVVADKIEVARENVGATKVATSSGAIDNGSLTNANGRAYGMILDASRGNIEFLMGSRIYELMTAPEVAIPSRSVYLSNAGTLYCLVQEEGIVTQLVSKGTDAGAKHYAELTAKEGFETIKERAKSQVSTTGNSEFQISDSTVYYIARVNEETGTITTYVPGTLRDVQPGAKIRAFDLTNDENPAADVAIVVRADDADKLK